MKNKNIFISRIISSIIIVLILFSIFINNTSLIKLIIIPFIACGIFNIVKNVCLIINKKKYADIFSKLFLISFLTFWFGFLIFGSYYIIKDRNYFLLLFTIPFWTAGIYITRKFLLGIETKIFPKKKESKVNFKIVISCFLVISVLLSGILCLFIGITDTYKLNKITKNYMTIDATFTDYEIYNTSKNNNSTTYKLIYVYKIDGKEYTISTDYGVGYIPEKNSIRKVKYNPNNPNESILTGTNSKNSLIYFGGFFILGSIPFILGALHIKGVFDKFKIDIIGLYLGFAFFIIGIGIILFQNGTTSSLPETIKSLGIWFIIPLLFIIVGIFQIIKCLFFKQLISNERIGIK